MPGDSKNTVTLTIDGRTCRAERSKTVLEVALKNGVSVPYFCYHPYLSVPGNCRQCQVRVGMEKDGEVRWAAKLGISCNTPVAEGMRVETQRGAGMWDELG